ncbi:MAG TPA: hypothetical protein VE980_07670 [Pyrinomonadaceae bacterium]|nr:hypothetical protein [Pyrinomonadaceae bacterium]
MFKNHRIVKSTTLLVALGLIMFVWTHARSVSPPSEEGTDTVKAVKLRLTFEGGDTANVTQLEGGTIKIEKDGTKLEITPYIRDQGQVELRVSQAVQGTETMQALDTMLVGKGIAKLNKGKLPLSVQVLDVDKKLPAKLLAAASAAQCCARTCSGVLICGVCVCTDCQVCMTIRWCDCAAP